MKDDAKLKIEEKNIGRPLGGKTTRYTLKSVFRDVACLMLLNVWNEVKVNTLHASKVVTTHLKTPMIKHTMYGQKI